MIARSFVLSLVLLSPMLALAQEEAPSRVALRDAECADLPFAWDAFASLLALELAEDGVVVDGIDDGALASFHVVTACTSAELSVDVVRVEIEDHVTQKLLSRDFDLAGVPMRSRARALALGAAELLRASWAELAMPAVPTPTIPVPSIVRAAVRVELRAPEPEPARPLTDPSPPAEATAASPREPAASLRAGAEVRVYASGNLALVGGFLHADVTLDSVVALRLGASGGYGQSSHPLGELDVAAIVGVLGASFGARVLGARLSLTPAVEVGWSGAWGRTRREDVLVSSGTAPLVLARVDLEAAFSVAEAIDLYAALGAGYAIVGLRATALESAFSGVTGPSVQVSLGVAARVD